MAHENTSVARPQGGNALRIGDVVFTWDGTNVVVTGLPTTNPAKAGALWSNSGVLTISSG